MSDENKVFIRDLYQKVYNEGQLDLIDEMYSADVELHMAGIPEDPFGPLPIKQFVHMVRTAFPSIAVRIDELLAVDDRVVAIISFLGDFQGNVTGSSPRENLSWWKRIDIYRVLGGRIVEQWGDRDDVTMLQRLGVAVSVFEDVRPAPRDSGRL